MSSSPRPSRRIWLALSLVLVVVGAVALVIAVSGQQSAPQPAAGTRSAAAPQTTAPQTTAPPAAPADSIPGGATEQPAVEDAQVPAPTSVTIPAIGVTSELMRLGLNDDGTVEVPPLEADDLAGWYEPGPAPGAVGPAVILGHVDSAEYGPGVFFELGALAPGDVVEVARADGSVAEFTVDRVERHPKDDFPTLDVYGNTDTPQLRLITCGGDFDSAERSYEDNIIVWATLSGTRSA